MIKNAQVTLIRDGEVSAIVNRTYAEDVSGFERIEWTPHHVVFHMPDGAMFAYKADRIYEIVTYNEEE
jgi:hypothetical protein